MVEMVNDSRNRVVISSMAGKDENLRGDSSNTALTTSTTVALMLMAIKASRIAGDRGMTIMTMTTSTKLAPTTSERLDAIRANSLTEESNFLVCTEVPK